MPDEIIRREFPAELVPSGDGRTLDLRVVPFNTVARVSDDGGRTVYEEMWMPGAFDRQLSAPNRVDVLVNFEHQQGIGGVVARGTELRDTGEALDMTARMLSVSDADKALELVNEGVVGGVSLEAIALKSERGSDGIVRRMKARLVNVALCRSPAFADAQVMAVREAPEEESTSSLDATIAGTAILTEPAPDEPTPDPAPEPDPEPEPEEASQRQFTHEEVVEVAANIERKSRVDELLERVGYEPLLKRAVTSKAWDGSASRFSDSEYERSCLICRGGDEPPKTRCSLPVLEPDGTLNTNALGAAAGRLNQLTGVTTAQKAAAARKLRRLYAQAEMDPPPSVVAMAGRA